MAFRVDLSQDAIDDLKHLRAHDRAAVIDRMKSVLTVAPEREGKSLVKLLRQPAPAQYRMRVGNYRVFYNVVDGAVEVVRVVHKEVALLLKGSGGEL